MIIIATEEEKHELYQHCKGKCDGCIFGYIEHCPIDDNYIITVDVIKTDTIHALFKSDEY